MKSPTSVKEQGVGLILMRWQELRYPALSAAFLLFAAFSEAMAEPQKRVSQGVDLVYLPELNITLVRDANLFRSQAQAYAGDFPTLIDEIVDRIGSVEGRLISQGDFMGDSGGMRWHGAVAWIQWLNQMSYGGSDAWRLWLPDPECGGRPADPEPHECPNGELGYLYSVIGQLSVARDPDPSIGQGWNADPPGVLGRYFVQLGGGYWSQSGDGTFVWARWMISDGGRQLAFNYTSPEIPNYFKGWPVLDGVLGLPSALFGDGFEVVENPAE
jgi:hypothetical protein